MATALSRFLGPVPLDVVVTETHESRLIITKNPVEAGADVTDHAIVEPKRLTLEAVAASRTGGIGGPAAAFQQLVALQESRQPFDIVTALKLYRNMLIEGLSVTRDSRNGRVLWFTADCTEVILVDTKTVAGSGEAGQRQAAPSSSKTTGDTAKRAEAPVERGTTQAPEVPDTGGGGGSNGSWLSETFG